MAIEVPALSDFSELKGPVRVDPDSKSTLTVPVVYSEYLPTGISRMNYVRVLTSLQVNQPNGLGVCTPLNAMSVSIKAIGINNSADVTGDGQGQQLDKASLNAAIDLLQQEIGSSTVVIPAPLPPI